MMNAKKAAFVLMSGALLLAAHVRANSVGTSSNISLFDNKEVQFLFGGFAEADYINDSTQSFTEVVGNNAVAPQSVAGGIAGNDGRTMFSIRNSRFDFTTIGPKINGWTDYGYMEFDLLGYDPSPSASAPKNSEGSFWENPTLRVRHMYAAAENGGFKILAGQTWDLFGFSPDYVMDTVSESPVRGDLYERIPQLTAFYTASDRNDAVMLDTAVSMERPVEDASEVPGFDAALRLDVPGWMGAYAGGSSSHVKLAKASFAVSGKVTTFDTPNQGDFLGGLPLDVSSTSYLSGEAIAFTTLIPVIPVTDKNFLGSLVLTGEFTSGSGYGDEFSGWSGGEGQFAYAPATPSTPAKPNLDAGQAGFYSDDSFHLMNLETFNFAAQYNLPANWFTYLNGGYSQLYSDNLAAMVGNPLNGFSATTAYNLVTDWYVNMSHDWSDSFRSSLEVDHFTTTYVDKVYAVDNRIMLSFFYLM